MKTVRTRSFATILNAHPLRLARIAFVLGTSLRLRVKLRRAKSVFMARRSFSEDGRERVRKTENSVSFEFGSSGRFPHPFTGEVSSHSLAMWLDGGGT